MTYEEIYSAAHADGHAAAIANTPTPVVFAEANGLSTQPDPNGQSWYVPEGVCGFGWVTFAGNTAFGRWAKKTGIAKKYHAGGLYIWVTDYGQSMDRKEAYAYAFAKVLQMHGISAYANSRMD